MNDHVEQISARDAGLVVRARPPSVLLVEDDDAFRRLAAAELRYAGYEVLEVADGADALELIGEKLSSPSSGVPDVVISDIKMPVLTGLHLTASLRNIRPSIPTILITSFGDAATHAAAERLGAVATLDKPFDLDVLCKLVDRILRRPMRRPSVLVVDESMADGDALSEILSDEGARATFATTASHALHAASLQPPDIVILDATLHGQCTGPLLERLRVRVPGLPAVVVSGFPVDHPHVAALVDARAVYLAKPVDIPRLLALIPG